MIIKNEKITQNKRTVCYYAWINDQALNVLTFVLGEIID